MSAEYFIDTNILVYAHDRDAGDKQKKAASILQELWQTRKAAVSIQVLQEFYVNVTKKIPTPLDRRVAFDIVQQYGNWQLLETDLRLVGDAIDIEKRVRLSFWDSLIVAAAERVGAHTLYTEDLNHGQRIGSVTVCNPFIE